MIVKQTKEATVVPGIAAYGIFTGAIKPGANLIDKVIRSVQQNPHVGCGFKHGDVVCVTEAVVAYSQENFCTYDQIAADWEYKTNSAEEAVVLVGLLSRNRGSWLKGILKAASLKKVTLVFGYPRDEQGNSFFPDEATMHQKLDGVNISEEVFDYNQFCERFGKPCHRFTGKDYPEWYMQMCKEAGVNVQILFCNNYARIKDYTECDTYLVGRVHDRDIVAKQLLELGIKKVLTLADLMTESVDGSGYNPEFGLLGCNHMDENTLKLFPRDGKAFAEKLKKRIYYRTGVKVEVMVYGDGAFKDPVGQIWELADPVVSPGYTDGLAGVKTGQVKAKKIIGENLDKTNAELVDMIRAAADNSKGDADLAENNALGTTPRRITDINGSLADLISGSGDAMTPVVLIRDHSKHEVYHTRLDKGDFVLGAVVATTAAILAAVCYKLKK